MDLTLLVLCRFSSVLPLFGVERKMLHNGHHASPLGLKNGRFSTILGLISTVSPWLWVWEVNGSNFYVPGPIFKCLTIVWGSTRNATQWAPFHPSIVKKRTFFVRFLSLTWVPWPGIELMTLWVHRFDSRARRLSSGTMMSETSLPSLGIELMTL